MRRYFIPRRTRGLRRAQGVQAPAQTVQLAAQLIYLPLLIGQCVIKLLHGVILKGQPCFQFVQALFRCHVPRFVDVRESFTAAG